MYFGTEAFEIGILNGIHNALSCPFMDYLMTGLSLIGNSGILWIICGFALIYTKKYRRWGIMLLIGLLLGLLFGNLIMKNIFERPRPCWITENVEMLIAIPTDYSFPSGHSLSSFVAAFVLYDANKKFGIPALIVAALTAFSRLYLFVHYPTDVLGGILLAALIYWVMKQALKLIMKKNP